MIGLRRFATRSKGMTRLWQWMTASIIATAVALPAIANDRVVYYHSDVTGSPVAATDATGSVIWRESYAPYGKRLEGAGADNQIWFTGKREESLLDLHYFGARWYDARLGRFLSPDPVGVREADIHSFNRYAYANNNPYRYTDPDGRSPVSVAARTGWAIGGALNTAVYHTTGVALTTLVVNAAWDILHNESSEGDAEVDKETEEGCIYCVKGNKTRSGKDYIGSSDDIKQREKDKSDGRDRSGADIVDRYPRGDRDARRTKEQQAMNDRGGVDKLDNRRNEIAPKKWNDKGVKSP